MEQIEIIENNEFERDLDDLIDSYIHFGDDVFHDILCNNSVNSCEGNIVEIMPVTTTTETTITETFPQLNVLD